MPKYVKILISSINLRVFFQKKEENSNNSPLNLNVSSYKFEVALSHETRNLNPIPNSLPNWYYAYHHSLQTQRAYLKPEAKYEEYDSFSPISNNPTSTLYSQDERNFL